MRTKHDCGLSLLKYFEEAIQVSLIDFNTRGALWMPGVKVRKAVEVSKLGGNTAEIGPNTVQNIVDLGRRLFRKSGDQIGAPDSIFGQERSDRPHEPPRDISHFVRVCQTQQLQETDNADADCGIGGVSACALQAPDCPPHR